jgi:hypothetical protein
MAEVSESPYKPVDHARLMEQVIEGMLATRLIARREDIVSTWRYRAGYGYPTPGLERDAALAEIVPFFESKGVYSRGRFGLWKYEVSNQDHSFMQGVEAVERIVNGRKERTAVDANRANRAKHAWPLRQPHDDFVTVQGRLDRHRRERRETAVKQRERPKRITRPLRCPPKTNGE